MKKQPYNNEDLIQQVQIYLKKILAETGSKQKQLRDSINNTLDILDEDLKFIQNKDQSQPNNVEIENNNNDTTSPKQNVEEIVKPDEVDESEISKQEESEISKQEDVSHISEVTETPIIPLIG